MQKYSDIDSTDLRILSLLIENAALTLYRDRKTGICVRRYRACAHEENWNNSVL